MWRSFLTTHILGGQFLFTLGKFKFVLWGREEKIGTLEFTPSQVSLKGHKSKLAECSPGL